ncbi:MAG: membrane protein insertase YidC [Algoriphagus sp.]|jgi:YidC/Oxa1 family membrane protein insertase|uniref:membrane protein insertase YidC n=2 Tax=Algoriphagus sp. TaxID=1872435 RepID=UPI00276E287D|nr:membrane protein insertase YidC [Algoriphagus sp.]MDP4747296.1 membrane protein insertase YidC [Algoriphagus sp.]MDP4838478.1 membrane protein insertase YidC [Algoriphagus sp.]MDP4904701.1 membrane protein insertase YidC [Algoriphagus sp.]
MDKNQATGLILFAAVILTYSLFFASNPEIPPVESTKPTVEATQNTPQPNTAVLLPDSLLDAQRQLQFGELASWTIGEEQNLTLENEVVKITVSTKGGAIKEVLLKKYFSWQNEPLFLLDSSHSSLNYSLDTRLGTVDLNEFYFAPQLSSETIEGVSQQILTLRASSASGQLIQKYTLSEGQYTLEKSFEIQGLQGIITAKSIRIDWEDQIKAQEKDLAESRRKTQVNYYLAEGSYDNLGLSDDPEEAKVDQPVKWIGFSQRFFTAGIIADSVFQEVALTQSTPSDSSIVRAMSASLSLPLQNGQAKLTHYFGPDQYKTLKAITPGFEENVDMGYFFVSWVNKYIVVHLFEFLEKYFNSYGIIIILIVLLIKLALSPLTYKSYIGMAKMRVIKPEIDELKEKYGDDATKMQQEQMKLFSQLGVSPISGCLPLVLQMPFLFAMFFFFPNAIELRQESFLWAEDLSTYDEFIKLPFTIPFYGAHVSLFTLLMTISQVLYAHFNNQLTTATGPMKNLGYVMPVMFMFVLNSYPAGLSFYYFVSNIFTFGQQALIKLFVDDSKIRQKVEENKLKNVDKKKSKFQQRLEDAMKAADANKKK